MLLAEFIEGTKDDVLLSPAFKPPLSPCSFGFANSIWLRVPAVDLVDFGCCGSGVADSNMPFEEESADPGLGEASPNLPFLDAAIIAVISASVTPSFPSRTNASLDVLKLHGSDWIAETTTDSGSFWWTIAMTSSLVSGFFGCCANSGA